MVYSEKYEPSANGSLAVDQQFKRALLHKLRIEQVLASVTTEDWSDGPILSRITCQKI